MIPYLIWILALSTIGSAALTVAVLAYARKVSLIDRPNERSSHLAPTPRGGGLAIVAVSITAFVFLAIRGEIRLDLAVALVVGGLAIAVVGFVDDRTPLSPAIRVSVQLAAAVLALVALDGLPQFMFGEQLVNLGWIGSVLAALGLVWITNLFNFMDGIDGIAASEATFVTLAGGAITWSAGANFGLTAAELGLAGASLGFLLWNWQPARIFMGDVGSGYLGFAIGVLAIGETRENPAALLVWLILGAAFVVDATVTLFRRLVRRERVFEAHRIHAYQWLSRRWGSHQRVTLTYLAVNLGWLLPLASYASLHPGRSAWIAVAALLPLIVLALIAGAGRPERGVAKAAHRPHQN